MQATYRVEVLANSTLGHCCQRALTGPRTWMTAPSVITPRNVNKLKKAKQLSGTASASNKSRFWAKCVCLRLRLRRPTGILARLDGSDNSGPEADPNDAMLECATEAARRAPTYSHLKRCAAAVDDESRQNSEKHSCGGDRPPVIFAPSWVGLSAVVTARRTADESNGIGEVLRFRHGFCSALSERYNPEARAAKPGR